MGSTPVDSPVEQPARSKHGEPIPETRAGLADDKQPKQTTDDSDSAQTAEATDARGQRNRFIFTSIPSWITSMVLHLIGLLVLASVAIPMREKQQDNELTLANVDSTLMQDEMPVFELQQPELTPTAFEPTDALPTATPITNLLSEETITSTANDLDSAAISQELSPFGINTATQSDILRDVGGVSGSGLEGRGGAAKAQLLREAGGTKESERAVQSGLKWLLNHQNPDGSWCFRHALGNCPCPDHGTHAEALNAATAMALLPFLGAGHTHQEGKYKTAVKRGIYYLLTHQQANGSFAEPKGHLYSHGLCAIMLSESYAMTKDRDLQKPAQAALNYIAFAQDPIGGGWRYQPKEPGDTSVVGWQLMALKSGKMAYLDVRPNVLLGAQKFLDYVQTDDGAAYGYNEPGERVATTAIGLLCRMYLGWDHDHPALVRGIKRISKSGPSKVDMYYNYYATQLMRHYEGEPWEKWNESMREFLIQTQERKGHLEGSWHMGNSHSADAGGRLYSTSLATMILEVYYRHLPIYRRQAAMDDFEL
jgi:hypothetical protein